MRMIFEFPNNFLITRDLEELRLFPDVTMPEVIANQGISVWQALTARGQTQWVAREIIFVQFPNHLLFSVQFQDLVTISAGDQ